MPKFGKRSTKNLSTCHPSLQLIFNEVIKYFDCSIIWGYRGEGDQNKAYHDGRSMKKYPNSMHNKVPSLALDCVPYPGLYRSTKEDFYFMAGIIKTIAWTYNVRIRWGGDWDCDLDFHDQSFFDLAHFELIL